MFFARCYSRPLSSGVLFFVPPAPHPTSFSEESNHQLHNGPLTLTFSVCGSLCPSGVTLRIAVISSHSSLEKIGREPCSLLKNIKKREKTKMWGLRDGHEVGGERDKKAQKSRIIPTARGKEGTDRTESMWCWGRGRVMVVLGWIMRDGKKSRGRGGGISESAGGRGVQSKSWEELRRRLACGIAARLSSSAAASWSPTSGKDF